MIGFYLGKVEGIGKITAILRKLPADARRVALEAMGRYAKGNTVRGLMHYPPARPSKYVRTYTLQRGWTMEVTSYSVKFGNKTPYAVYVQGNPPAVHMARRGWRSYVEIIQSSFKGMIQAAQQALNRYLKGLS